MYLLQGDRNAGCDRWNEKSMTLPEGIWYIKTIIKGDRACIMEKYIESVPSDIEFEKLLKSMVFDLYI